ncbi:MAG: peptidase T [Treponema sp.]|jgi:tripeptide aminopeptidase|nr:peptidase T [Treponema sp.]
MRFKEVDEKNITASIVSRFLRYVQVWTTSCRHVEKTPSTPGQWDLAKLLAEELQTLGVKDVSLTDSCYVIARLPASAGKENVPRVGFLAHLDTSDEVSGKDVKPHLVKNYDGGVIYLAGNLRLDPALDPDLAAQKGKSIIHTDGTTLLGADDKAGIAEIMSAVEWLIQRPEIAHGDVEIIFSPDEETGKGLPDFPYGKSRAAVCYTLDGGALGEIEVECFNAAEATLTFTGKSIHPGYARGKMANAVVMAANFVNMLPRSESPEATDGYFGYFYASEINGTTEKARLDVLVRDFDSGAMKKRLERLAFFAKAVEAQFPDGTVNVEITDQYHNMKEKIDEHPEALDMLMQALSSTGVDVRIKPIRGGTDGSRLTEMGIPTPNIFTGGRNWHGTLEWVSVPEMTAACKVVIELIRLWGEV